MKGTLLVFFIKPKAFIFLSVFLILTNITCAESVSDSIEVGEVGAIDIGGSDQLPETYRQGQGYDNQDEIYTDPSYEMDKGPSEQFEEAPKSSTEDPREDEEVFEGDLDASCDDEEINPCEDTLALEGRAYEHELRGDFSDARSIYRTLLECEPDNPVYNYRLGRVLSWQGRWMESEKRLTRAIELRPGYYDAEMALGVLYLWQNKLCAAEELFDRYPESMYAQENLGKIDMRRGDYACAKDKFIFILRLDPGNREVRRALAAACAGLRDYSGHERVLLQEGEDAPEATPSPAPLLKFISYISEKILGKKQVKPNILPTIDISIPEYAKEVLVEYTNDFPNDDLGWRDLFAVKHHTNYWMNTRGGYSWYEETDLSNSDVCVTDVITDYSISAYFPVLNEYLFWIRPFIDTRTQTVRNDTTSLEREYFDAILTGAEVGGTWYLPRDWSWNLALRVETSLKKGSSFLKLNEKTLVLPYTSFVYDTVSDTFVLDGGLDSLLVRDFANLEYKLLQTGYIGADYMHYFSGNLKPFTNVALRGIFYDEIEDKNNIQGMERLQVGMYAPGWVDRLAFYYQLEHTHFDNVVAAYPSWKNRVSNSLGIDLKLRDDGTILEASYVYSFVYLKDFSTVGGVVIPGDTTFHSHYLFADLSQRWKDAILLGVQGRYYISSFPYHAFRASGRLEWVF